MKRFDVGALSIADFVDSFLVCCPECGGCARVTSDSTGRYTRVTDVRLSCPQCHYMGRRAHSGFVTCYSSNSGNFAPGMVGIGALVDAYFHLPLWLQTSCCGDVLWAYNINHLQWLKSFVSATLRTRAQNEHGWSNQSLASRLPKWVKSRNNRPKVLAAIAKLERRMERMHAVWGGEGC